MLAYRKDILLSMWNCEQLVGLKNKEKLPFCVYSMYCLDQLKDLFTLFFLFSCQMIFDSLKWGALGLVLFFFVCFYVCFIV